MRGRNFLFRGLSEFYGKTPCKEAESFRAMWCEPKKLLVQNLYFLRSSGVSNSNNVKKCRFANWRYGVEKQIYL